MCLGVTKLAYSCVCFGMYVIVCLQSPEGHFMHDDFLLKTCAVSNQSQAACQAITALLLADMHAPDQYCRPAISLTNMYG